MIEGPGSEVETNVVPDVFLENLAVFEGPDVRIDGFVRFERPDVRIEDLLRYDTPPAPLETFAVFEGPDVRIDEFVRFERPDVRIEDLLRYDTPPARRKSQFREWLESLAFTIIFVLVFTSYIAQATQVPTESMKPTILVGDHFFLDKLAFPANYPEAVRPFLPRRSINRGDIVAFKSPTDGNIPFVKRVIGVPGDTIEVRNKELHINGSLMDEPYKIHVDSTTYSADSWTPEELKIRDNYGPVTVPPGSYFVMGDNRDNSNDSRYWGFVTWDEVIGKPLFVYWSYESDPYIPGEKTWREWAEGYLLIGMHFFDRTRWFRMGTMIE